MQRIETGPDFQQCQELVAGGRRWVLSLQGEEKENS
jgi:hypothetical protein